MSHLINVDIKEYNNLLEFKTIVESWKYVLSKYSFPSGVNYLYCNEEAMKEEVIKINKDLKEKIVIKDDTIEEQKKEILNLRHSLEKEKSKKSIFRFFR